MKAVILAGGLGTRIAEESDTKPKPMVEIGGKPLLWHIMRSYANHGIKDFVICLGYKGYVIKEFFLNYYSHMSDMTIDLGTGEHKILGSQAEDWRITLVDTGAETMTGGRLKRAAPYLNNETFCLTYGDGLSNIDISAEVEFHRRHGKLATVAAVQPPGRFGVLNIDDNNNVSSFEEKPSDEIGWINGGFFVLEPEVIKYIDGDEISWEREPLTNLAKDGQLSAFHHTGFWQPCDTLRDKRELEALWANNKAPWRI
jgi:glucose-1-phosphate cytidylyltransferase